MPQLTRPKALLIDYGGTLVEELSYDPPAGAEMLLSRAVVRPAGASFDAVMQRVTRVTREVASRRTQFQIETPWPALTRLIYDYFGVEFAEPLSELELDFWRATVTTRAKPGARAALDAIHERRIPTAVVSNSSFGPHVIRYELDRHGLAHHLSFVMASAEYAIRKPNRLLFETAAARIGVLPRDIWFIGDSIETDIAGARAAGMTAVLLSAQGDNAPGDADLLASGWSAVLDALSACST